MNNWGLIVKTKSFCPPGGTHHRSKFDLAAKRHKKLKNKISVLVISMGYNEQKSKFGLFTSSSNLEVDECSK